MTSSFKTLCAHLSSITVPCLLAGAFIACSDSSESRPPTTVGVELEATDCNFLGCNACGTGEAKIIDVSTLSMTPLARRIYEQWRLAAKAHYVLTDDEFAKHVGVTAIEFPSENADGFWRVDYVYRIGWAQSSESSVVRIAQTPTDLVTVNSSSTDDKLAYATQHSLPGIPVSHAYVSLPDKARVEESIRSCLGEAVADSCSLGFYNSGGHQDLLDNRLDLGLRVRITVDMTQNKCKQASVNLETGELASCGETICAIPN